MAAAAAAASAAASAAAAATAAALSAAPACPASRHEKPLEKQQAPAFGRDIACCLLINDLRMKLGSELTGSSMRPKGSRSPGPGETRDFPLSISKL